MATLKKDIFGRQYMDCTVPVLTAQVQSREVDTDVNTDYPLRDNIVFEPTDAKVFWYPDFDFSSGFVGITPVVTAISCSIEASIILDTELSADSMMIEIDGVSLPQQRIKATRDKYQTEHDSLFGPRGIVFEINKQGEVTATVNFY